MAVNEIESIFHAAVVDSDERGVDVDVDVALVRESPVTGGVLSNGERGGTRNSAGCNDPIATLRICGLSSSTLSLLLLFMLLMVTKEMLYLM